MFIPGPIKKILAIFRGKVSFAMILLSVALGFWFGMIPSFTGLSLALLCVVLILNVNIALFLLSAALGKALLFAAAPLVYHVGLFVHGNAKFLIDILASIPVIAMTDFSSIALAGTLIIGPIVGLAIGFALAKAVSLFKKQYIKLYENSESFNKWHDKKWVRIIDRILLGKAAKNPIAALTAKPSNIRIPGIALVAMILIAAIGLTIFAPKEKIKQTVAQKITSMNGAQVDLATLDLNPLAGNLSLTGLQVTNAEKPTQNKIAADKLTADASLQGLLMGKLIVDDLEISNLRFDTPRETPGTVLEKPAPKTDAQQQASKAKLPANLNLQTLDKVLKNSDQIKQWLTKLSEFLPESQQTPDPQAAQAPQNYLEYISAKTLLAPAARVIAKRIAFDNVDLQWAPLEQSAVTLLNLSDAPAALNKPVTLNVKSMKTPAEMSLKYDFATQPGKPNLSGTFTGFELASLGTSSDLKFQTGAATGTIAGTFLAGEMDLTIQATLNDLKLADNSAGIFGTDRQTTAQILGSLGNAPITMRLLGSPKNPQISIDTAKLAQQFKEKALELGKQRATAEIDKQLNNQIGDKVDPELKESISSGIKGLLGGDK